MARDGRRRRVLNEEARTASGLNVARMTEAVDHDAPRYGEQASIENHPQITDYIPRRKRAVILTVFAGGATAAAAQATIRFADPIAQAIPGLTADNLVDRFAHGAVAWTSAVALLLSAMVARLMFNLRRHRVDDYAGRYRVWRWITWGAALASFNAVTQVHSVLGDIAQSATGKTLTAGGAEWWLAPVGLVGGWMFIKLALEISESRSSLAMLMLAGGCYLAAAAGALGLAPAALTGWGNPLTTALPLAGHTFALAGLLIFGRYVVLDVQGLIEHRPKAAAEKPAKKNSAAPRSKAGASTSSETIAIDAGRMTADAKSSAAAKFASAGENEEDDEDEATSTGSQKLSKIDRKRLRREQRAA
jgi:hypothetical protein